MSKLRDISKKKESIKSTISGLALALAIGGLGSFGSYAYFTAKAEVNNVLNVIMGTFDVNKNYDHGYTEDINIGKDKKNVSQKFTITNNGTLDQYLKFKFSDFTNTGILSKLNATLIMTADKNQKVYLEGKNSISSLNDLKDMSLSPIVDVNGNKFKLAAGKSITCELTIDISNLSDNDLKLIEEKTIKFNTKVESVQINAQGGGNN